MARRPFVHLAGDLSGWPSGFAPQPAHMRALDQFSSELVDGETGGTWAPIDPIVIGPLGTPTMTLSTVGSVLSGDIETTSTNELGAELDDPGLILQSGAVPTFQSSRTRNVTVGFTHAIEAESAAASGIPRALTDPFTLGTVLRGSVSSSRILSVPLPFRAQHRGATISQVDFRVIVAGVYTVIPATMMRVRIIKVVGDVTSFLHTNAGAYDANGWYVDQAATVAAFVNNGQVRTLSYVPNQNNTSLDPSTAWYMVQVRAASSMTIGSVFLSATVQLSAIADYRQE